MAQSRPGTSSRHEPAPATHGAAEDLLILRDGSTLTGALLGCVGLSCSINGVPIARSTIEWIGLRGEHPPAPAVVNPAEDEVHLADRSVQPGALVGISASEVATDRGPFPRSNVRWVHLAPPPGAPDQGQSGGGGGGSGGGDEGGGQTTEPPPPPPPPPSPPPPPHPPKKNPPPGGGGSHTATYERGGLWSGVIHVHLRQASNNAVAPGFTDVRTDISARLRERRYPLLRPTDGGRFGSMVRLEPEGTELRTKLVSDVTGQYAGTHCEGRGEVTVTVGADEPDRGDGSVIYVSRTDADTTPWLGFPVVRGTPRYVVSIGIPATQRFSVTCTSWVVDAGGRRENSSSREDSFSPVVVGAIPVVGCLSFIKHYCDPEIRTIQGDNGRMYGSFHNAWEQDGYHNDYEVRWSLCRDDAPCTEEPPAPEKNPCQGTAIQDGLLQQCRDKERSIIASLDATWSAYQGALDTAAPHQADFMKAFAACTAWETSEVVIEALLTVEAPSIGLSAEDAAEVKEFKENLELINKLMKAATTGDPMQVLVPSELSQIEKAAEAVKRFIENFHLIESGTAESFLAHLDECNAPISQELRSSAQQYLLDMQRGFEELEKYHTIENDLRSQENACLQAQWDAYQACLDDAACRGVPPTGCESLKPPGDWVPPR